MKNTNFGYILPVPVLVYFTKMSVVDPVIPHSNRPDLDPTSNREKKNRIHLRTHSGHFLTSLDAYCKEVIQ